jgi:hypothetical protein
MFGVAPSADFVFSVVDAGRSPSAQKLFFYGCSLVVNLFAAGK